MHIYIYILTSSHIFSWHAFDKDRPSFARVVELLFQVRHVGHFWAFVMFIFIYVYFFFLILAGQILHRAPCKHKRIELKADIFLCTIINFYFYCIYFSHHLPNWETESFCWIFKNILFSSWKNYSQSKKFRNSRKLNNIFSGFFCFLTKYFEKPPSKGAQSITETDKLLRNFRPLNEIYIYIHPQNSSFLHNLELSYCIPLSPSHINFGKFGLSR